METDWSVAAGADDPVIEAAWSDAATGLAWVDLRTDAETQRSRIATLQEAVASPSLARALAMLNAPSPDGLLLTTKCDRWVLSGDELEELADVLDAPRAAFGYGSYIDVLMTHPVPMADFLLHEEWARMAALRCAALDHADVRLELVVRPAHKDGEGDGVWGYGLTVYHYAGGDDAERAEAAWAAAMDATVPVLIATAAAMIVPADQAEGA